MSLLLTDDELYQLTRRQSAAAQARVLTRLGVPFKTHPTDGVLLVSRAAAEAAMGAPITAAPRSANDEWEVRIPGGKHGPAQAAR